MRQGTALVRIFLNASSLIIVSPQRTVAPARENIFVRLLRILNTDRCSIRSSIFTTFPIRNRSDIVVYSAIFTLFVVYPYPCISRCLTDCTLNISNMTVADTSTINRIPTYISITRVITYCYRFLHTCT